MLQINWKIGKSESPFYAGSCVARGLPAVDPNQEQGLVPLIRAIQAELEPYRVNAGNLLAAMIPMAGEWSDLKQLARIALIKLTDTPTADRLSGLVAAPLAQLRANFQLGQPFLDEELPLRVAPIREQWEARGGGIFAAIQELIGGNILVEEARVVVVSPWCGGGVTVHAPQNAVCIEGVLYDPNGELPEVVRLAWALSQLNCDLPGFSENIQTSRRGFVAALATLPAILEAAQTVELIRPEKANLAATLSAWHGIFSQQAIAGSIPENSAAPAENQTLLPQPDVQVIAEAVKDWWGTYQENRVDWGTALTALDRLLAGPA